MEEYNSSHIHELDPISHIRLRPDSYINNSGASGQRFLVKEIVDNSIDELEETGIGGGIALVLFRDLEKVRYQVAVRDTGRGIPPDSLIKVFTNAMTGGKFNQDAYKFSAGLNGIGSTVVMALSSYFRAFSFRGGKIYDSGILNHSDVIADRKITSVSIDDKERHGTTVVYSPDKAIVTEVYEFIMDPDQIVDYFTKMSLFINFDMKIIIVDNTIPEDMLKADTLTFNTFLDNAFESKCVFDNRVFDRNKYLKKMYGVDDDFEFGVGVEYANKNNTLLLNGTINITFSKVKLNAICSVNNIVFTDQESYHYTLIQMYLRKYIKLLIDDIKVRQFFEKRYVIPIWVDMVIKFAGAKFSGMEKTSFKDTNFRAPYTDALSSIIDEKTIIEIYDVIKGDLQEAYTQYCAKELVVNDSGILSQLNNPQSFTNCRSNNPDETELFIIEGLSAKEPEARDPNFQAFYAIRGKIFNAVDKNTEEDLQRARVSLVTEPLYSDIIKILNLGSKLNTDNLAFKKIFLMADADIHGFHIANILLANLYLICPELVTNGHVYVVKAPLYKIRTGPKTPQLFARDYDDLIVGLVNRVFYNTLEITLRTPTKDIFLDKDKFLGFVGWVYQIGEYITSVSKEYFVEPIILEQLSLVADKLENPDAKELSSILGVPIKYDKGSDVLSCSIGYDDIHIHLGGLRDVIQTQIRPKLSEFIDGNITPLVTTKRNSSLKEEKMSVIQIYGILKKLQGSLEIEKMKGLGSMSKNEKIATCMDPEKRRAHQITSIGDLEMIFNLMGKDSQYRKALL